ncbi:CHAT domain-containing protein [Chitinophaga sp. Mgbs1]|uniref:CHAT domain-containing protein n=1 Tax=Chitinophaga solisilvae TaxID=1233460 RepID=A0A433WIL8_9BACT|nr:CHAT domain-containing protein [Chitinophaga solisilvae]
MAEVCAYISLCKKWCPVWVFLFLFSGRGSAQPTDSLYHYRSHNQLSAWIYAQLQQPAASAAEKSVLLNKAITAAWRQPQTDEEVQAWQDLLINHGYTLLMSGDIVSSTAAYQQAFEWARSHTAVTDESLVLEYILKPLGNNYTRLGDYEQALFIHRKALALAVSLDDKAAMAGTYSNLANTAGTMGQLEQALRYCREGFKAAAPNSAIYGLLLSEAADAAFRLQQQATAADNIRRSIRILERQPAGDKEAAHWLFMAYQQAGDIHIADSVIARQYYQQALQCLYRRQVNRKREQARLYQRLARYYVQLQQPQQALAWADSCAAILLPGKKWATLTEQDMYGEYTLLDMLFMRAAACNQLQQRDATLHAYRLCFATENKLHSQYISHTSKELAVSDSRQRYESAIAAAYQGWIQTRQERYRHAILEFMESSRSQLLWEEMQRGRQQHSGDTLLRRIRLLEQAQVYYQKEALQAGGADSLLQARQQRIAWDLATLRKKLPAAQTDTMSLSFLLKSLPNKHIIRSYFTGATALYTVEAGQHGIRYADRQEVVPGWYDSIRHFRQHYFEEGDKAMVNAPGAYYAAAYRLYTQLFQAHPLPAGITCILMPDGVLNTLPAEALVTKPVCPAAIDRWPFVVKEATISYAYSLRTWQAQRTSAASSKGFSGFFIARQPGGLPDLQGVEEEKRRISPAINNGSWYLNEQATTGNFRQALLQSAVVHISTHAFLKAQQQDAPHIALYDKPFYLFELNGLTTHPAMVVLSACGTGDGRLVSGEGVQSMAHAFIAAGTPAVVAASWNVNDATTPQLMQQYYIGLTTQPNAAIALQRAKLNWLENLDVTDMHKLPYYWAALQYQGDTLALQQGIREKQYRGLYWLALIGILIAAVLAGRIFLKK